MRPDYDHLHDIEARRSNIRLLTGPLRQLFVLFCFGLSLPVGATEGLALRTAGKWPGDINGFSLRVEVVDHRAFVGFEGGLGIYDVANPAAPLFLGGYSTEDAVVGMHICGNRAYLANTNLGFTIVDVTDPARITRIGRYFPEHPIIAIQVVDNLAYTLNSLAGLEILDVSNPTNIIRIGSIRAEEEFSRGTTLEVVEKRIFVIDDYNGLRIYDATDPSHPKRLGKFSLGESSQHGLKVMGNYAYLAGLNHGLSVLDVSNPSNVVRVGGYDTSALGIDIVGNRAFLCGSETGLVVLELSDATNLQFVTSIPLEGFPIQLRWDSGYAFVPAVWGGLHIVDLSPLEATPAGSPFVAGSIKPSRNLARIHVDDNKAYVVDYPSDLRILDVSDAAAVTELGRYRSPLVLNVVRPVGNRVYLGGTGGMEILDTSDPLHIQRLGSYNGLTVADIQLDSNRAYVTYGYFMIVLDVSNPAEIRSIGASSVGPSGERTAVRCMEGLAFVADGSAGVRVLDISNLSNIRTIGSFAPENGARSIEIAGPRLYAMDYGRGLHIIDISNSTNLIRLGQFEAAGSFILSMAVEGAVIYLTSQDGGLEILDATDPTNIVRLATSSDFPFINAINVFANQLYQISNGTDLIISTIASRWGAPKVLDGDLLVTLYSQGRGLAVIERSNNLSEWVPVFTNTLSQPRTQLRLPANTAASLLRVRTTP